ncbi:hypothetical protein [Hydrogenimonas sp.]
MGVINYEAEISTLDALLEGIEEISALKSGDFNTTRITNVIHALRREGITIETHYKQAPSGKRYGVYRLVESKENRIKAARLRRRLKEKQAARQAVAAKKADTKVYHAKAAK